MSTLTADLFISLDGCAAADDVGPLFGYGGPDVQQWIDHELGRRQVLLLGRNTFEMFASTMPAASDPNSERISALPKLVASSSLTEPLPWVNSRLLHGDALEVLPEVKRAGVDPLRTMGSVSLVRSLLANGLVDRLRLMIFPLACGRRGRERFFEDGELTRFELLQTTVLDRGIVLVEYRPAASND